MDRAASSVCAGRATSVRIRATCLHTSVVKKSAAASQDQCAFGNVFHATFGLRSGAGHRATASVEDVADRSRRDGVSDVLERALNPVVAHVGLSLAMLTIRARSRLG